MIINDQITTAQPHIYGLSPEPIFKKCFSLGPFGTWQNRGPEPAHEHAQMAMASVGSNVSYSMIFILKYIKIIFFKLLLILKLIK